jgi:hypothetical protein
MKSQTNNTKIEMNVPENITITGDKYFMLLKRALNIKDGGDVSMKQCIKSLLYNLSISTLSRTLQETKDELSLVTEFISMMEEKAYVPLDLVKTYNGNAYSVSQLLEAGWNIEQISKLPDYVGVLTVSDTANPKLH